MLLTASPLPGRNQPWETWPWKKLLCPPRAALLPHACILHLAFTLAASRRPHLISFHSYWVRAQVSQKCNCLENPLFLQLGLQEGFSHTLWFCSRGQGHGTGEGGYAASLPIQLTQWAWRKAHHLHSPWVTSGLGQFTVYISQQKQTTQIPRH